MAWRRSGVRAPSAPLVHRSELTGVPVSQLPVTRTSPSRHSVRRPRDPVIPEVQRSPRRPAEYSSVHGDLIEASNVVAPGLWRHFGAIIDRWCRPGGAPPFSRGPGGSSPSLSLVSVATMAEAPRFSCSGSDHPGRTSLPDGLAGCLCRGSRATARRRAAGQHQAGGQQRAAGQRHEGRQREAGGRDHAVATIAAWTRVRPAACGCRPSGRPTT
jgi:hypothetical protein